MVEVLEASGSIARQVEDIKRQSRYLEAQIYALECLHIHTKVRKKRATNGTYMYHEQCVRCGEYVGNWIPHSKIENETKIEPINEGLRESYLLNKRELELSFRRRIAENDERINQLLNHTNQQEEDARYRQYLLSTEWKAKRKLVLERCNHTCEGCGLKRAIIVHHLSYKNKYSEFLFELIGLGADCHDRVHERGMWECRS